MLAEITRQPVGSDLFSSVFINLTIYFPVTEPSSKSWPPIHQTEEDQKEEIATSCKHMYTEWFIKTLCYSTFADNWYNADSFSSRTVLFDLAADCRCETLWCLAAKPDWSNCIYACMIRDSHVKSLESRFLSTLYELFCQVDRSRPILTALPLALWGSRLLWETGRNMFRPLFLPPSFWVHMFPQCFTISASQPPAAAGQIPASEGQRDLQPNPWLLL